MSQTKYCDCLISIDPTKGDIWNFWTDTCPNGYQMATDDGELYCGKTARVEAELEESCSRVCDEYING